MKNKGALYIVLVTCIAVAFAAGLYIGRNWGHGDVQLSPLPSLTDPPQLSPGGDAPSDPTGATSPQIVNINTAGIDELSTLKNIGPVLAQRIISFRGKNGPFKNVTDLLKVEGIGTKTLEAILDYITVGG